MRIDSATRGTRVSPAALANEQASSRFYTFLLCSPLPLPQPCSQIIFDFCGVTISCEFDSLPEQLGGYTHAEPHRFDEKGALYWIATAGRTQPYVNPHRSGLMLAAMEPQLP